MSRAVVLVNPTSRWLVGPGPVRDAVLAPRPGIEVVTTCSLLELEETAARLAETPPETVVLAGGDGSHGAGLSALARAFDQRGLPLPIVALAPAGTTCTVARNWSWRGGGLLTAGPRAAARACARVIDAVARGEAPRLAVTRPTLRIATGGSSRVAFILGAGLVARFFEVYEREGAGGYRTAASIVLRVFAGSLVSGPSRGALARRVLEPVPCVLTVDGTPAPFAEVSLFVASVVRDLGLSMRLTYRAGEAPTRFHVVASPLGARALGPQLPRVLAARPLAGPRVDALASRAALAFPRGEGAVVVDGDLVRADDVVVEAGPVVRVVALDRRE